MPVERRLVEEIHLTLLARERVISLAVCTIMLALFGVEFAIEPYWKLEWFLSADDCLKAFPQPGNGQRNGLKVLE